MKEIWKDIKGYKGLYKVSNLGRVKSFYFKKAKIISCYRRTRYEQCILTKNGKIKMKLIHRLVAEAFIPNPENKPCVNHLDINTHNNKVDNLEWCTYSENCLYSANKNGVYRGEKNGKAILTEKEVIEIRRLKKHKTLKELSEKYNTSESNIHAIVSKTNWQHI